MNTDGTGFYTCKECHQTESLWNPITTDHKEGEQLEDWGNVGESSCNSGDGTVQRVQSLMFMMMMIKKIQNSKFKIGTEFLTFIFCTTSACWWSSRSKHVASCCKNRHGFYNRKYLCFS